MQEERRVEELVLEKIADRKDLFLVGVKMTPNGKLSVWIDGDNGVSIQDCADISRYVGRVLEEENVIEHAYHLEVSSPGLDAPLQSRRQYEKNVGRMVEVSLSDGDRSLTKEGTLLAVTEEAIMLEEVLKSKNLPKGRKPPVQEIEIPFDTIIATKVLISFK